MPTETQDKRYLDIHLSTAIGHAVGIIAPPLIVYDLAEFANLAFLAVWVLMIFTSFAALKFKIKSQFGKALAQSTLVSCVVVFLFVIAAGVMIRQILPPVCC